MDDRSVDRHPARVLVVAAMPEEFEAVTAEVAGTRTAVGPFRAHQGEQVSIVESGIGPANAAAATATALAVAGPFDVAVSAGVGGAFPTSHLEAGRLVVATEIVAGDFGIEEGSAFRDAHELEWVAVAFRHDEALVRAAVDHAGAVPGPIVTVSAMSDSVQRVARFTGRRPPALAEGMEGLGVALAAARWGVANGELRAICNVVGHNDLSRWSMEEALGALAAGLRATLGALSANR